MDFRTPLSAFALALVFGLLSPAALTVPVAAAAPANASTPKVRNDAATVVAGKRTTVKVLRNDKASKRAKVRVTKVPAGLSAKVTKGRAIRIRATATAAPRRAAIRYRVTEPNGRKAGARVRVTITAPGSGDQRLRILGINDFHGQLSEPSGSAGRIATGPTASVDAGGAAYLGTHVRRLSAAAPNSVFVGAGDLIGASPLNSGLFHDEPTVEALNAMGMQFTGVGNHEFDEGPAELLRMQFGGCHPTDGCQDGDGFVGGLYRYLAANVRLQDTDRTLLPPYTIKRVGDVPVAYIGLTLEGTPRVVTQAGVAGLTFDDEASTVNRLVRELSDSQGIEAFVVMLHEGGQQNAPYANGFQDVDRCENPTGDVFPIVDALDTRVDAVLSAHTHQPYLCERNGMTVTSAASQGRLITTLDLTLSGATGDVTSIKTDNVIVTRDVPRDPAVDAIVTKYTNLSQPIANRVVGQKSAPITRTVNPAGESALGDVIADAQLAATDDPGEGDAVIAFMNPGGIRADLAQPGGDVTFGHLFDVQPFANSLATKTFTGAQIKALLEQQFDNPSAGQNRILQVSNGFTYTYDASAPAGSRVSNIALGGTPIVPATTYRVTMNSFLASGGDGFSVFGQGTAETSAPGFDLDALEAYFASSVSPVTPGPQNRITRLP